MQRAHNSDVLLPFYSFFDRFVFASAYTDTESAPASYKSDAHADSVEPVVIISSIKMTRLCDIFSLIPRLSLTDSDADSARSAADFVFCASRAVFLNAHIISHPSSRDSCFAVIIMWSPPCSRTDRLRLGANVRTAFDIAGSPPRLIRSAKRLAAKLMLSLFSVLFIE